VGCVLRPVAALSLHSRRQSLRGDRRHQRRHAVAPSTAFLGRIEVHTDPEVLDRATCAGHANVGRDTGVVTRAHFVAREDRGVRKASREAAGVLAEHRHSVDEVRSTLQVAPKVDEVDEDLGVLRNEARPQRLEDVSRDEAKQLFGVEVRIDVMVGAAGRVHALMVAGGWHKARHPAG